MHARVTELKVDLDVTTVVDALTRFRAAVLPSLQEQPGYRGIYVLGTPAGDGLLVSLWATEDAARADHQDDWYYQVMRDLATLLRERPSQATYQVLASDLPG